MARKLKPSNTPSDRERIESLERGLEAAKKEHRRLKEQLDELQGRDPLEGFRDALKQSSPKAAHGMALRPYHRHPGDPDDTVN